MGNPLVVVIAETQKCSQRNCGGALKWIGGETLGIPPAYTLECGKCGCHHQYQQDDDSPTKVKLFDVTYFPTDEARLTVVRAAGGKEMPVEFFAYEMLGPAVANSEGVMVADIHEIPDTVKIAETKVCGIVGCVGELKWNGTQSRSNPIQYPLICQTCGAYNNFVQDNGGPIIGAKLVDVLVVDVPKEPVLPDVARIAEMKVCGVPGCIGELKFSGLIEDVYPACYPMICQTCGANNRYVRDLGGLVIGAKLDNIVEKEPEPEPEATGFDAPSDLMDAARLLAKQLDVNVYVTAKSSGGCIPLPKDYWGISLVQDMYDGRYCIHPDGKVMETEQWT